LILFEISIFLKLKKKKEKQETKEIQQHMNSAD